MYAVAPARGEWLTVAEPMALRLSLKEAEAVVERSRRAGAAVRVWRWGPDGAMEPVETESRKEES